MSKASKQLKKMKRMQEEYQKLIRKEQATCPHVSKKGNSKLVKFIEGGIEKGRCSKCGEVVIVDKQYISREAIETSTNIIKTALAELRAAEHTGRIDLDEKELELISKFDSEVLRELPETIENLTGKADKKKNKKKGKKHKKKNKGHKRKRWQNNI